MIKNQRWIKAGWNMMTDECPVYVKNFTVESVEKAILSVTARGVYFAEINGKRVGRALMTPGYTQYSMRLQYQTYDITDLLCNSENHLEITVTPGWWWGRIIASRRISYHEIPWDGELIAEIIITDKEGKTVTVGTDESWLCGKGPLIYSDIYDGEIYDATKTLSNLVSAKFSENDSVDELIHQEGEWVEEHERFTTCSVFITPKGEKVIDFGQNLTGYPVLNINAKAGNVVSLSFAEILDSNGNFYNENYRTARCQYKYVCRDGEQSYRPRCTFYGFRYVRVDEFPQDVPLTSDTFTAVAIYSNMKRTGNINTSNKKLNQLFSNVLWGQRDNFCDIPMDCPQRDERLGWTGDAQFFCKTASYNFDVHTFYKKWLRDMSAYFREYGYVGFIVPGGPSPIASAYTDAGVIIPWQIYKTYGDRAFLEEMIEMMTGVVDMIKRESEEPNTWRGGKNLRQFGDWLATDSLDRDRGAEFVSTSYSGASNPDLLQAAFFANDARIVAEALEVLGRDSSKYRKLFEAIKARFQEEFPEYKTQTECIIALHFGLAKKPEETIDLLVRKIRENGNRISTGFVGTPYVLYALSENGRTDLAYSLLLQEEYPSWLFCVNLGATTMWEHWDGINIEGIMWNKRMNSFNHCAYGSVASWIYEVAGGIKQENDSAGFDKIVIEPHPDSRLDWLETSLETKDGKISSKWIYMIGGGLKYEISVPKQATIVIGGVRRQIEAGNHVFYEKQ